MRTERTAAASFDFDSADEWNDIAGESTDVIAHDLLLQAIAEDPFSTSHLDDCAPFMGLAPSEVARYERASAAYIAACHAREQDDDKQEILRLIAAYWLKKSRAFWLD